MRTASIGLLMLFSIVMLPAGTAVSPDSFAWTTDPASGNIEDDLCYDSVDADNDIDCAGTENWCTDKNDNQACDTADDEWVCGDGDWACNNGERIEPAEYEGCEPVELEGESCYSTLNGEYQCYSNGEQFITKIPAGCECEDNSECDSGLCQDNVCVDLTAPIIEIGPPRISVE